MLKIAVLISGRGSNLQALIDKTKEPNFPATIVCVLANKSNIEGLKRAQNAGIPVEVIRHQDFADKISFETALDQKLTDYGVQLVCLAGFMRVLSAYFVDRWRDRLVNIHPSLLPAFPGLNTHQQALKSGVRFSGCTVHFVRAAVDHGPIIAQAVVPVMADDDEDELAARILTAEHRLYPDVVRWIAENRVNILDEKVFIVDTHTQPDVLINPYEDQTLAKKKATP